MASEQKDSGERAPEPGLLTALPAPLKWGLLILLSGLLAACFEWVQLPAALLLGPMVAAILFAINGARMAVPPAPSIAAQAAIGCLIANAIDGDIVATLAVDWPLFLASVLAVILATTLMGYVMARMRILPGTTAVWGTSAGAASAMMMMSESFGADARLVAFMQYLRVVCVASTASLIAALVFDARSGHAEAMIWFPPVDWIALAMTVAVAAIGTAIGRLSRLPAGMLFAPMFLAAGLHAAGLLKIELPPWLLAAAYLLLGWRIGLTFTRRILRHAMHALPQIMASIVILIVFCGGLALLLIEGAGIDPLTAYLATSPGGIDSVAIIAASTPVDVSFVMALQAMRLILVLLLGPPISRLVARRVPA